MAHVAVSANQMKAIGTKGIVLSVLCAMAFGIYPSTSKMAYRDGANPVFLIIATTFLRALLLFVVCFFQRKSVYCKRKELMRVASAGFFQAVSIFGILASLVYLPGPVTITIVFTHTILLFLLLVIRKEVTMDVVTLCISLVALLGVACVVDLWGNNDFTSYFGICLALIGALASVARMYLFGKQLEQGDPSIVGAQIFFATFLFTTLLVFYDMPIGPQTLQGYGWVLVSGLSLALPTYGMFYCISLIGSFQFSLLMKIEPIFTTVFSILILGEFLKTTQYVGILLVIVSLVLYQFHTARLRRRSASQ